MIDITAKSNSLRRATASAVVVVSMSETTQALLEGRIPKGNVLDVAKAAGLLAAKRTSDTIPHCHPIPIEYMDVRYRIEELSINVEVEIAAIYKTGVEVEAMYSASVVALTIYDMLKPIDPKISIEKIGLVEKRGGKSELRKDIERGPFKAAVIVCSDTISAGKKEDKSGLAIVRKLKECEVEILDYKIIPDEAEQIRALTKQYASQQVHLVIITGGTGLSPRDVTPEALEPIISKRIAGIEEVVRSYGQQRTPYSMLSRSVAGLVDNTLVLALPGSTRGAEESMDAVFPAVLHLFKMMGGGAH